MHSPPDYEQSRRQTAARRRGLAKYLPETKPPPTKASPAEAPPEDAGGSLRLPAFISLLTPVLLVFCLLLPPLHNSPVPLHSAGGDAEPIILEAQVPAPDGTDSGGIHQNSEVINILLLGNDSREEDVTQRTDAMILVSINPAAERIYLTSFLRDLYVPVPGYGNQRLNAANVLGGPTLTLETIEQNFGISIHHYAQVSFTAFESIIDTLGGVELYLTTAEALHLELGQTGGSYPLSGKNALAYCRIRALDSDFARTERQRTLLETLWADLQGIAPPEAAELLMILLPQVSTDMTWADCLHLLSVAGNARDFEIISRSIPAPGTYEITMVRDMSVLLADMEENAALLRTTLYGK